MFSNTNPTLIAQQVMAYMCLLFSICFHEAAHSFVANRCGDPTARLMGRSTLNPVKHIDPIGTVVMPLIMAITGIPYLIGWARPVPVNPRNFNNMRRDSMLVSLAGPASNLLLGSTALVLLFLAVAITSGRPGTAATETVVSLLVLLVFTNSALMLFNLIPVPPLDGHHILAYFLPDSGVDALERIGPMGIIIAIVAARFVLPYPMRVVGELVSNVVAFAGSIG